MGGHVQARRLWRDYYADVGGIVFVVDTADRERFAECRTELDGVLGADELRGVPVLVLGNKSDAAGAVGEEGLRGVLGLGYTSEFLSLLFAFVFFCCFGDGGRDIALWGDAVLWGRVRLGLTIFSSWEGKCDV
jgi:hypothetical protein